MRWTWLCRVGGLFGMGCVMGCLVGCSSPAPPPNLPFPEFEAPREHEAPSAVPVEAADDPGVSEPPEVPPPLPEVPEEPSPGSDEEPVEPE
jgi:hypothetical protein